MAAGQDLCQSGRGSSVDSQAGQQAFGRGRESAHEEKTSAGLGRLAVKLFWKMQEGMFRSAPS